jgi:hypothetical protein
LRVRSQPKTVLRPRVRKFGFSPRTPRSIYASSFRSSSPADQLAQQKPKPAPPPRLLTNGSRPSSPIFIVPELDTSLSSSPGRLRSLRSLGPYAKAATTSTLYKAAVSHPSRRPIPLCLAFQSHATRQSAEFAAGPLFDSSTWSPVGGSRHHLELRKDKSHTGSLFPSLDTNRSTVAPCRPSQPSCPLPPAGIRPPPCISTSVSYSPRSPSISVDGEFLST